MAKSHALAFPLDREEVEREPILELPFCHKEFHCNGRDEGRVSPDLSLLKEFKEQHTQVTEKLVLENMKLKSEFKKLTEELNREDITQLEEEGLRLTLSGFQLRLSTVMRQMEGSGASSGALAREAVSNFFSRASSRSA